MLERKDYMPILAILVGILFVIVIRRIIIDTLAVEKAARSRNYREREWESRRREPSMERKSISPDPPRKIPMPELKAAKNYQRHRSDR